MHINTGILIDWAFIWKTFPWNTTFIINEGHTTTKYYNKIASFNGKVICMGNNQVFINYKPLKSMANQFLFE